MAEIRRLDAENILQLYKIHTMAFNLRRDFSKEDEQKPDPLAHPAEWALGVFDGKKLLAGTFDLEFLMRFDGHSVKLSGISGVAALPEARNEGYVRKIMEKLLIENYEKGVIFSNLTPFDHGFYRKFGYETACARTHITINTGDMSDIESNGKFVHILPGDDTSLLAEVHSAYIADINHGIHRDSWPDNRAWNRFTREDPCTSGYFVYLWKDEKGKARSYIKFQDVTEDGDHNMNVTELAFIDKKGLYGALSLAGTLSPQYENFKWLAPTFIEPFDLISDAWSVETEIRPRDMTRVINVKAALELMRRPEGSGQYIIEIEDENIEANNGKFLVEFGANETKVTPTKKNPCLSCDILTLSQLITGYRSLENAIYTRQEGLEVHSSEETLKRVFTLRPQHVTEYF